MKESSIIVISVIMKLKHRVVLRPIFNLSIEESSILVVSVIMKLQHRVFLGPIFSLNMKDKYLCNQCDYKLQKREISRDILSLNMKGSGILAIIVIMKLQLHLCNQTQS